MTQIIISKENILQQEGVVILPLKEYQKLCEKAVPAYYLKGKEAEKLDTLVKEGLKEYEYGETISASSLKEALKYHGRKKNKKN